MPTWNYAIVQASGPMQVIEDRDWLETQIGALTAHAGRRARRAVGGERRARGYVEAQLKGIVGIEIPIARIEGKWKVSQNRPEADRRGVVEGLRAEGDEESDAMAEACPRTRTA